MASLRDFDLKKCFLIGLLCATLLFGAGQLEVAAVRKIEANMPELHYAYLGPCSKYPNCSEQCFKNGFTMGGKCMSPQPGVELTCYCIY